MDEQMIAVRKVAAELLGYTGDDAVGILRGDFDDKWDCPRVGKEVARVIAGKVAEIADDLTDQCDEPLDCSNVVRLHYWRDKAIDAAEKLAALAPYPERQSE